MEVFPLRDLSITIVYVDSFNNPCRIIVNSSSRFQILIQPGCLINLGMKFAECAIFRVSRD